MYVEAQFLLNYYTLRNIHMMLNVTANFLVIIQRPIQLYPTGTAEIYVFLYSRKEYS